MTANAAKFVIEPSKNPASESTRKELMSNPGFGKIFSDHMATIQWNREEGWHSPKITERVPFAIDPAAAVLHYAQEIFEGMKAYRSADDHILLFRPDQNAKRFNKSAERMAMPQLPEELFLQAVNELVKIDAAWVPEGEGSLYLRPFMFATEPFLGVRPSDNYTFCVIASTVGAYFKGGVKPLSLWISDHFNRAGPGGTGAAKCGGNYAASLSAQIEAYHKECDQVIFLDATERKWVEELGGMNLFFLMDDGSLVTPPLNGSILPGITRDSVIKLAQQRGITVHERLYSIKEFEDDAASGKLVGAFACGTAAVIVPIGTIKGKDTQFTVPSSGKGADLIADLREKLTGIQRGTVATDFDWVSKVI